MTPEVSPRALIVTAGAGSLAMILGAWFFEFVIGLAPCAMCYWQRWPHMAAVAIAVVAAAPLPRPARIAAALAGAAAAMATSAIGLYHTGVERDWWEGPASCTGSGQDLGSLSGAALLDFDAAPAVVLCDEVAWSLLGLSMASWNALISLGLAALWLTAALARPACPSAA